MKRLEIQKWECKTSGDSELQHFLPPDCTYLFGFNRVLLGKRHIGKCYESFKEHYGGKENESR